MAAPSRLPETGTHGPAGAGAPYTPGMIACSFTPIPCSPDLGLPVYW